MLVRSAVTPMPVLGGALGLVTRTVNSVLLAGNTESGIAMPSPDGCVGSPPHPLTGDALLRGIGPSATKSAELLSVSVQPLPRRIAALTLLFSGGAGALPSAQFAPP